MQATITEGLRLRSAFDAIDVDSSGTLDKTEISSALKQVSARHHIRLDINIGPNDTDDKTLVGRLVAGGGPMFGPTSGLCIGIADGMLAVGGY